LGIASLRHLVVGEGVEKLQVRVGRVQFEGCVELLRALVQTVFTHQHQRLAHGLA
jgi:hypothetical protein